MLLLVQEAKIGPLERNVTVMGEKVKISKSKIKAIDIIYDQCITFRRAAVLYLQGLSFPLELKKVCVDS